MYTCTYIYIDQRPLLIFNMDMETHVEVQIRIVMSIYTVQYWITDKTNLDFIDMDRQ